jgi:hypothetical protein
MCDIAPTKIWRSGYLTGMYAGASYLWQHYVPYELTQRVRRVTARIWKVK